LVILAFFSSGLLVVINRCLAWAADSELRMRAFEVARENMEKLLSSSSVKEMSEYGDSEKYPQIKWQTDVETFYEPVSSRMWVRAICTATYKDAFGEDQQIELRHWLTNLSKKQLLEVLEREEKEKALLAGQLFDSLEEAAVYAGVDVQTIEDWIDNGMVTLEDGSIPKQNLDTFANSGGKPTAEQVQSQVQSREELITPETTTQPEQAAPGREATPADIEEWLDKVDPATGLTYRELEEMSVQELFDLLLKRRGQ